MNAIAMQTSRWSALQYSDIDTDSDNDNVLSRTEAEDVVEDGSANVGKRIFINHDDDNKNGIPDIDDASAGYTYDSNNYTDNDFAEIKLGFDGAIPAGYQLWLGYEYAGLQLYAGTQKEVLTADSTYTYGSDKWYIWSDGEVGDGIPDTVYAEGTALGNYKVYWRLVEAGSGGTGVIARDTVKINVEAIVWPFTDQQQGWQDLATDQWVGLALADAWYIDKALVDYIEVPSVKGSISTIHPDTEFNGVPGYARRTTGEVSGPSSTTTESYAAGFVMEFDYSFDVGRNPSLGYVQAEAYKSGTTPPNTVLQQKLSFVGNSGIKFGGKEVAILDVASMVSLGGGLAAFDPDQGGGIKDTGEVDISPFATETLNRLMTGVIYNGDYSKMTDNPIAPTIPSTKSQFHAILENNHSRENGEMRIEVAYVSNAWEVKVFLDGQVTASYADSNLNLATFTTLDVQSHWGSGVVFSDMNIISI